MIVDLSRDQACFIDGALDGSPVVGAPLVPETHSDQSSEWNDTGDDKRDKSRSNAAKQHYSPLPALLNGNYAGEISAPFRRARMDGIFLIGLIQD